MDDTVPVGGLECVGDLGAESQHLVQGQGAARQSRRQRLTFQQLEYEVVGLVLAADIVQAADMRVIQGRDRSGLPGEAPAELGIVRQIRREDLDRHATIESGVTGFVHLAHASRADEGDDLVGSETDTGPKRHAGGTLYAPLMWRPRRWSMSRVRCGALPKLVTPGQGHTGAPICG
jgi:hypothetical protein